MTSGFEKSGTVLTVHLPAELDHPASDEIRRESDRIIGHDYIKNMIFDFSETVFMDSSGIGLLMGRYRALIWNLQHMHQKGRFIRDSREN